MPPPQRLVSGLRGFVCKSCRSKLPREPWLSRNIHSEERSWKPKGAPSTPDLRFYEQYPDGTRTDITEVEDLKNNSEQDALGIAMMQRIEELEAHTGQSIEELVEGQGIDLEAGEKLDKDSGLVPSMAEVEAEFPTDYKPLQTLQAIYDKMEEVPDLGSLSLEGREKYRAEISKIMEDDEYKVEADSESSNSAKIQTPYQQPLSSKYSIPFNDFPKEHQRHINNFKQVLEAVDRYQPPSQSSRSKNLKNSKRRKLRDEKFPPADRVKSLGTAYALARKGLRSKSSKLPPTIWTTLWNILGAEGQHNPNRMAHIKRIGEDMDEIEAPMLPSQRLLYIEALFVEGLHKAALKQWEEASHLAELLGNQYWELGLRMSSRLGHLEQATHAAEKVFYGPKDLSCYRALIPLIHAYLTSNTELSVQRAWALFVRVKANLGTHMTMEDYDAVISSFMEAGEPELGLAAFRDMMLTGDASSGKHDSVSIHEAYTGSTGFSGIDITLNELNWKDPKMLSLLPAKFKNKFFFGSWVKKLIGEGNLEAARQVLDLTQDHGIRPSPIHMNGLIGAWFREGTEKCWIQAEELAWKMIRLRIEYMEGRQRKHDTRQNLQYPLRPKLSKDLPSHLTLENFPQATVETFTLLIREYRQRQKSEAMSDLFEAWRKTGLPPTTRFLNQLLLMDLRGRHKNWAWETFCVLTEKKNIQPNTRTFEILWDLEKRNVDPTIGGVRSKSEYFSRRRFPSPRHLFAEMMKYKSNLIKEGRMKRDMYDLIILCFSLNQDQAGTAVALRALHRHFNMYPNEDTARMLVYQVSRLGLVNYAGIAPRRLNLSSEITKDRIASVATLVQKFRNQRIQALLEKGIIFDDMSDNEKLEETLIMFSDILRYAAQSKWAAQDTNVKTAEESAKSAFQMGVPDCVTWHNGV